MSKATAIKMLKCELAKHKEFEMIGFKREYLERIIAELEEEEGTEGEFAFRA